MIFVHNPIMHYFPGRKLSWHLCNPPLFSRVSPFVWDTHTLKPAFISFNLTLHKQTSKLRTTQVVSCLGTFKRELGLKCWGDSPTTMSTPIQQLWDVFGNHIWPAKCSQKYGRQMDWRHQLWAETRGVENIIISIKVLICSACLIWNHSGK